MRVLLVAAFLAAIASTGASAQVKQLKDLFTYTYTARVDGRVRVEGDVAAGGFVWRCKDDACEGVLPFRRPKTPICILLAKVIGRVSYFGREGAELAPEDLEKCNKNAPDPLPAEAASEPSDEEPAYEEPPYEEPEYEEPPYEEPGYEEPDYEEPAYEEPEYDEPSAEELAEEEPT